MLNDRHLNDYTPADAALERLRQKAKAERAERWTEIKQIAAMAAVVVGLLWAMGGLQ